MTATRDDAATSDHDDHETLVEALAALRYATRVRHGLVLGSPEHRHALEEEVRLSRVIFRIARDGAETRRA